MHIPTFAQMCGISTRQISRSAQAGFETSANPSISVICEVAEAIGARLVLSITDAIDVKGSTDSLELVKGVPNVEEWCMAHITELCQCFIDELGDIDLPVSSNKAAMLMRRAIDKDEWNLGWMFMMEHNIDPEPIEVDGELQGEGYCPTRSECASVVSTYLIKTAMVPAFLKEDSYLRGIFSALYNAYNNIDDKRAFNTAVLDSVGMPRSVRGDTYV